MNPTMFTGPLNFYPSLFFPMNFMPMLAFPPMPTMGPLSGPMGPAQFSPFGRMPGSTIEMRMAYLQNQKQQLLQLQKNVANYSKSIEEALASIEAEISETEKTKPK